MKDLQRDISVVHHKQNSPKDHEDTSGEVDLNTKIVVLNQRIVPRKTWHAPLDEQRYTRYSEGVPVAEETGEDKPYSKDHNARPD